MIPETPPPDVRRQAFLAALLAPGDGAAAEPGELVLGRVLAEQMSSPELDLAALVSRWTALRGVEALSEGVRQALDEMAATGAPPTEAVPGMGGLAPALACLPLVGRVWASEINVASGAYHLARLLHSDPTAHWQAVGLSVATACFLQGVRDPIPDVIGALRANQAPEAVTEAARRVPVWSRPPGRRPGDFEELLWCLYHVREPARVSEALAGRGPIVLRLAFAMAAARNGRAALNGSSV